MKVYFLISLHAQGGETLYRNLYSEYMNSCNGPDRFGTASEFNRQDVQFVLFGSPSQLKTVKRNQYLHGQSSEEVLEESKGVNAYLIASSMVAYIQRTTTQSTSYYHRPEPEPEPEGPIYIAGKNLDGDFWASMLKDSVLGRLMFLDPVASNLHEQFGCGKSCVAECAYCTSGYSYSKVKYKKCDPAEVKRHSRTFRYGQCMNSDCDQLFTECSGEKLTQHLKSMDFTHQEKCKRCTLIPFHCVCNAKANLIAAGRCYSCNSHNIFPNLEKHFKKCCRKRFPYLEIGGLLGVCKCGYIFMDNDCEVRHGASCRKYKPTPPPAKKYLDTTRYWTAWPPQCTEAAVISPVNTFAYKILESICDAFGFENATMYTLSSEEIARIRSVSKNLDDILRSSGIVSMSVGFGSVDKGTGVPGYADVDMLVFVNGFAPLKRKEYATTFRTVLQAAKANLKESADDILQVEFDGVEFDLVLVASNAEDNDKRAADFAEARSNVKDLRAVVGTNNYVKEVIRAAKYWSKRSFPAGGIKSCLIEAIVLAQYKAQKAALEALTTQKKRRMRLFELFMQFVSTHTPVASPPPGGDLLTQLLANSPITPEQRAAAKVAAEQIARL